MKTILFAGGGTLGPVTPLLAVARRMKKMDPNISFAWAGTQEGPERELVERERIPFYVIPTAKMPRYLSWEIFSWPSKYAAARNAAKALIARVQPSLVIGAGGFTQVPVIKEAAKLKIPCAIHQLDAEPGLSNRFVAKRCVSVTTSFAYERPPFSGVRAERVPSPCRFAGVVMPDAQAGRERFFLDAQKPTIFVLGGGTGAIAINTAIRQIKTRLLPGIQIVHVTGRGKTSTHEQEAAKQESGYVLSELMDEQDVRFAYAAADVVVCRAGLGTLTELAELQKAAIVIPIPGSQQERNVESLKEGIVPLHQSDVFADQLFQTITNLLGDSNQRVFLGKTLHQALPTDDGSALAKRWLGLLTAGDFTK